MSTPGLLARVRNRHVSEVVEVSLSGDPAAVVAVARALASVTVVTGMRHRVQGDDVIRLEATCHPIRRVETAARKAARR